MRSFFAVAVLAASVSAVSLNHASSLGQVKSPFGTAVLAELDAHLASGGPADDLMRIVNDIRSRLTAAQAKDSSEYQKDMTWCTNTENQLLNDIALKQGEITANENKQDTERSNIENAIQAIKSWNEKITGTEGEITQTIADIKLSKERRIEENGVYNQSRQDTDECIEAINEILDLEGGALLKANELDSEETTKAHWRSLLESAASKASGTAKALVVAAASTEGNVSDLGAMLQKLLTELGKYGTELDNDEATAVSQYKEKQAELHTTWAGLNATLIEQTAARDGELANKAAAEGRLATLESEWAVLDSELTTLNNDLAAHRKACADWTTDYNARTQERTEEQGTLDQIEAIITQKLGHLFDANKASADGYKQDTATRVANVTGNFDYA